MGRTNEISLFFRSLLSLVRGMREVFIFNTFKLMFFAFLRKENHKKVGKLLFKLSAHNK